MWAFIARHKKILLILVGLCVYSTVVVYATPPGSPYDAGETLDPNCAPGDTNCSVVTTIYTDGTLTGSGTVDDPFSVVGSIDAVPVLSVGAATTGVLAGSPTYNNGTSGVGATLTEASSGQISSIDGVTPSNGTRLLVKDQVTDTQNGVYVVTDIGSVSTPYILTRTSDSDESSELTDQIVSPSAGTVNKGKLFSQEASDPVIGTDSITYVRTTALYVSQKSTGTQIAGQIPFWTSKTKQLSKGSANFVWDSTHNRLGIGTATPAVALDVVGGAQFTGNIIIKSDPWMIGNNDGVNPGLYVTLDGRFGMKDFSVTERTGPTNNIPLFDVNRTNASNNAFIKFFNGNGFYSQFSASNSADYTYMLPTASGTIPLSINGTTANSNGDITLATWNLVGNAGTTAGANFLGTTDNQDLVFKRNGTEFSRITASNTYFSQPVWNNATLRQDDAAGFGFTAPVGNQALTIGGFSGGAVVSNTAQGAYLNLVANKFVANNFSNSVATGSITAIGAYAGNYVDGADESADLYRTYASFINNKSISIIPVTNAVGYDFNIENGTSAGTQTFTNIYGYRTTPISTYHPGGILSSGGKYYGFYADATVAASIAGGKGYGFYQVANAANNITNVFQGSTSIGTTSDPLYSLQVGNSSVSGIVARFQNSSGTCDINPTTTSLSCSSDQILKKNITTIDEIAHSDNDTAVTDVILQKILSLRPVTYNWNTETDSDPKHIGFVAQEVQAIFPDLVSQDATTQLFSLNYIGLIPYTIKALQEMNVKISVLPVETDQTFTDRLTTFLKGIAEEGAVLIDRINASQATINHIDTDELCVRDATGSVCLSAEQLRRLLDLGVIEGTTGATGTGTVEPDPAITNSDTDTGSVVLPIDNNTTPATDDIDSSVDTNVDQVDSGAESATQ